MKKSLVLMLAIIVSISLFSFKNANTETEISKKANYPFTFYTTSLPETRSGNLGEIVLGNNMGIPFSLSNMRDAAQFIDENSDLGLAAIVPTHYYVKFMPVTNDHLVVLDSLSDIYALYNYPIEYVVVQEGDHMARSSSVSTSTYNKFDPIYASIPVNDMLPDVPYNIVDTLCDPNEDDNDLMITSYVLTGNASELGILYNGEIFTENSLKEYLLLPNATRASVKYLPNGHLTGLFWDIFDNNFDDNSYTINGQTGDTICRIVDYLQIGNMNYLTPIYNKLVGSVDSETDLKIRLLSSYPSKRSQINQLFLTYGY